MRKNTLLLVGALFGATASALAIPSTLGIDFRTAAWTSAGGKTQDTVGNITVTAAFPVGSTLTQSSSAGIGINSPASFGHCDGRYSKSHFQRRVRQWSDWSMGN